jgi:hypothetical protein
MVLDFAKPDEDKLKELKQSIEDKLSQLVNYYNWDYAKPIKENLLKEIDVKLKGYLENCDDKNLGILLLLNEFISGVLVGFRR